MSTAANIVQFLLEYDDDQEWKDVVHAAIPQPSPNRFGKKYGTQIRYGRYSINWHDYPDGSKIVSLYSFGPKLVWVNVKDQKNKRTARHLRWTKGWNGDGFPVKLEPGHDWDAWLRQTIEILDKYANGGTRRDRPRLPDPRKEQNR